MPRLLLTGATGLLGGWIYQDARLRGWEVIRLTRRPVTGSPSVVTSDLDSPGDLISRIGDLQPDWLIHCAAESSAARCELDPVHARQSNVSLTALFAMVADQLNCPFLFISTDMVFRGDRGGYTEQDSPDPVHVYGQSKASSESVCLSVSHRQWIVRPSLLLGLSSDGTRGYTDSLLRDLQAGKTITAFSDEFRSALPAQVAASLINDMAGKAVPFGLYHLGADDPADRYSMAITLAKTLGLPEHLIRNGSIQAFTGLPARQSSLTLNSSRLKSALGITHIPGAGAVNGSRPLIII